MKTIDKILLFLLVAIIIHAVLVVKYDVNLFALSNLKKSEIVEKKSDVVSKAQETSIPEKPIIKNINYKCRECRDTGEAVCQNCKGNGSSICSRCNGAGISMCSACEDGKKEIGCDMCGGRKFSKGSGTIVRQAQSIDNHGNVIWTDVQQTCPRCNGSGWGTKKCRFCGGGGKSNCEYCRGAGKLSCRVCHGKGSKVCIRCYASR